MGEAGLGHQVPVPRSAISQILWPAVPDGRGALLLAMQFQFSQSEWLEPQELEGMQLDCLARLVDHAWRTVPHYRDLPEFAALAGRPALSPEDWRRLPVLTRAALQDAGGAVRSESVPAGHEPLGEILTTGSTGRPVRGLTTRVTTLFWLAITLREILWHGRDMTGKLAAIRADPHNRLPPGGVNLPNWGAHLSSAYSTGPCAVLGISQDVASQAEWLIAQDPDYLLSYPSNLQALAQHFSGTGARLPRLRAVSTYGEALSPSVRAACREAWGVPVVDMYSSQELGYIALQCPQGERYHVQSEAVYVEVLDEQGRPCGPGEIGRIVISTLHNYAMPLLRYEIGDYAEVGGPCPCGRGLPVLNRIMGRQRNMWAQPTGQRVWPMFSSLVWGHIDAVRQLQLVQHEIEHIEARIVGPRPLTATEEDEFTGLLRQHFTYPFRLSFSYLDEIDRTATRKFEDFVSKVAP